MNDYQHKIVQLVRAGETFASSCTALDIPRSTGYYWLRNNKDFKRAIRDAKRKYGAFKKLEETKGTSSQAEDRRFSPDLELWQKKFLENYIKFEGVKTKAATATGISIRKINSELRKDPTFEEEFRLCEREIADIYEDRIKESALKGNGAHLTKVLAALRPERWGNKVSVDQTVRASFQPSSSMEDQCMQLVAEIVDDPRNSTGAVPAPEQARGLPSGAAEGQGEKGPEAPNADTG